MMAEMLDIAALRWVIANVSVRRMIKELFTNQSLNDGIDVAQCLAQIVVHVADIDRQAVLPVVAADAPTDSG